MLGFNASYFYIGNPLRLLDSWLHRPTLRTQIELQGRPMLVRWTRRADRQMRRVPAVTAELQLYFTCVVQKRVVFHPRMLPEATAVNQQLAVVFRTVQSPACDPVEFAAHHPVQRQLTAAGAQRMRPRALRIDFRAGQWCGAFEL